MRRAALLLAMVTAALCAQPKLDFPMSLAASQDGKFVLVLSAGVESSITVLTTATPQREVSRVSMPDAWLGLAFAPGGKKVYAGGAARGSVYEFDFSAEGELKLARELKAGGFVGDVALSPDGRLIYAADLFGNAVNVINPQSGRVIDHFKTGRRPYRIVFHPDGNSYFVSSWADAAVYQYNTVNGEEIGRIRLGPHTTDMVLSDFIPSEEEGTAASAKYRLFVAAANTNNVFVVGIGAKKALSLLDTIDVAPSSGGAISPLGMTPSALALSADQKNLFVVCSDADAVANVDVSEARGVVAGFLPAGEYPTAVRVFGSNSQNVLIANGRGNSITVEDGEAYQELPEVPVPTPEAGGEHVVYVVPSSGAEAVMRAIAGIAPDFTVKLGRRPEFNFNDPANTPLAGYLWTNVLAAGRTVQNYGVFMRDGQAMDVPLRPFSEPDTKNFLADLKEGEASGDMPGLILLNGNDPSRQMVIDAVMKSRFGPKTKIVDNGDLGAVEDFLNLRPMTRKDRARRDAPPQ